MAEGKAINQRIGTNIKLAREKTGYTQEQFSERLGVTPNHLSAVERGTCGASLDLLERLCRTFHVSADFLFFGPSQTDSEIAALARQLGQAEGHKQAAIQSALRPWWSCRNDRGQDKAATPLVKGGVRSAGGLCSRMGVRTA